MTNWALKNYRFTFVAIFLIIIAGLMSYSTMPRSEDPGFIIRTARVTTQFPGASPERVEELVTDKLEESIQEIAEIDYIKSESRTGLSMIDVNIREQYTDIRPIWDNLRRKVDRVRPDLPTGVIGPYVNDEFGDVFGTLVTITGPDYTYAELKDIADLARDELLRLKDVAKVDRVGTQPERVYIEYNDARLAELGLSANELRQLLTGRNIISPGGYVSNDYERFTVEPTGNFESLNDLSETVLTLPGSGKTIFLKDVATVSPGYVSPQNQIVRYSGDPTLVLAISMREGGNIIKLGEQIEEVIDRLQKTYPVGISFQFAAQQSRVVNKIIDDFTVNLIQAVCFVIIVMLLTLGMRIGILVASMIPTVILLTFVAMRFFDISLDQMSLAALVISLGLFVDNAIVMNESCIVNVANGMTPKDAAISSAKELKVPLLIASLTTSAAFLPIYLAKSAAGEYTSSIFEVVTISLLASWLLAMTMTPLLAWFYIQVPKQQKKNLIDRIIPKYEAALEWALRRRKLVAYIALGGFLLAMLGFKIVPDIFFPSNERPMITIGIEMPSSTPIARTDQVTAEVEEWLQNKDEVEDWVTYVGRGAPRFYLSYSPENPHPEYAFIMANVHSNEAADRLLDELRQFGDANLPDAKLSLRRLEYGVIVKYPVQIRIEGREIEELQQLATDVKLKLSSISGVVNTNDDWGRMTKKLVVDVDQPRALRAGVSSEDVANSLQTYLTGYETSEFRRGEDIIPIILRSEEPDRENPARIKGLNIYSQKGGNVVVPLEQVADVKTEFQPGKILRRDTIRTITVQSDLKPGTTAQEVLKELLPWLQEESVTWPPGYNYAIGGEKEESAKASKSITQQIPIAVLAIILLLMAQFNSLRATLIILLTIPLGLIGVVIALLVSGLPMGFISFLGIISLSGIVINNGIVLIDRINLEIAEGRTPYQAVIQAAKLRFRPILLTTATTVTGMIPLVYGGGPMFAPMAVVIVGGLLFATLLTLFIVPILYTAFYKVSIERP